MVKVFFNDYHVCFCDVDYVYHMCTKNGFGLVDFLGDVSF